MSDLAFVVFPAACFVLTIACMLLFRAWQRALKLLAAEQERASGLEAALGSYTGMGAPLDG